nr:nucleic acid-binding, OB-fold protein [Tanacetum cinerariifolium]
MVHSLLQSTAIINDGSATISVTCFSDQANSLTSDCNELLAEFIDKDPYHLPSTLKEFEDTTRIFQFHFNSESTKRKRDFVLDRVFKHQSLPLPGPPVKSDTLPSTSYGQPEQIPEPKPASPALSTTASNERDISKIDMENLEQPLFTPPPHKRS